MRYHYKKIEFLNAQCAVQLRELLSLDDSPEKPKVKGGGGGKASSSFGCYLWPSAIVLSMWLADNAENLLLSKDSGKKERVRVLELGAGVGLPGLLLATLSPLFHVTLSDSSEAESLGVLDNLRETIKANGLSPKNCTVMALDWGEPSPPSPLASSSSSSYDFIIASDVFYHPPLFESVLQTVKEHMKVNPRLQFITSYQERSSKRSLFPLLKEYGITASVIPFPPARGDGPVNCLEEILLRLQISHGLEIDNQLAFQYEDSSANSVFIFVMCAAMK